MKKPQNNKINDSVYEKQKNGSASHYYPDLNTRKAAVGCSAEASA